jgi:hypothetical protein
MHRQFGEEERNSAMTRDLESFCVTIQGFVAMIQEEPLFSCKFFCPHFRIARQTFASFAGRLAFEGITQAVHICTKYRTL